MSDTIGAADTLIESADAPSAASPILTDADLASIALSPDSAAFPVSPAARELTRQATKRFAVWTVMMLLGLSMLIHAIITEFWWYIALAVLIAPLSFWKFLGAKRAWQRGRRFWTAVSDAVGSDQ